MNYYLVDYENVKVHGLDGISKLNAEDVVCIFYSEKADTLTFGLHKRLNESKAAIIYQKVDVGGKNALDFQLSSYLGYMIHENMEKEVSYYIVTKDKGYISLVDYWEKRKINISIVADISEKSELKLQEEPKQQEELKQQVEQLIEETDAADEVAKLILQYKTKSELNNALMKKFPSKDNKKASKIYKAVKPLIADKKGK